MCGRFAFYSPAQAAAELFGVSNAPDIERRYNIAPTQYIATIRPNPQGAKEVVMLRWGLVPFWAKDPSIGNRMINARAETVAEKPSFRNAFRKRRCLVLADGYYEWQRSGEIKVPWFISRSDDAPMAFAGLWNPGTIRSRTARSKRSRLSPRKPTGFSSSCIIACRSYWTRTWRKPGWNPAHRCPRRRRTFAPGR